jgi:hypothetical protein
MAIEVNRRYLTEPGPTLNQFQCYRIGQRFSSTRQNEAIIRLLEQTESDKFVRFGCE